MENPQSVPEGYETSINSAINRFEKMDGPQFKGFLKISARPAGTKSSISKELYCTDGNPRSRITIFEDFCILLQQAEKIYGKKDFIFEILNSRNDLLSEIRLNFSTKIAEAAAVELQAFTSPEPAAPAAQPQIENPPPAAKPHKARYIKLKKTAPVAVPKDEPAPATGPEQNTGPVNPEPGSPEENAKPAPETLPPRAAPENHSATQLCPNPEDKIDYNSMKFYPTETTPSHIRKVFQACGIETNGDVLRRLGTHEPSFEDWNFFIRGIRTDAQRAEIKFWPSADGVLYWWLSNKLKWIRPLAKK